MRRCRGLGRMSVLTILAIVWSCAPAMLATGTSPRVTTGLLNALTDYRQAGNAQQFGNRLRGQGLGWETHFDTLRPCANPQLCGPAGTTTMRIEPIVDVHRLDDPGPFGTVVARITNLGQHPDAVHNAAPGATYALVAHQKGRWTLVRVTGVHGQYQVEAVNDGKIRYWYACHRYATPPTTAQARHTRPEVCNQVAMNHPEVERGGGDTQRRFAEGTEAGWTTCTAGCCTYEQQ